jgi:hypothetical protein
MKPFFATPSIDGKYCGAYKRSFQSLLCGLTRSGIEFECADLEFHSHILRARNELWSQFLIERVDCDLLFLVDADIGFRPQDAANQLRCGLDFVVGPYPNKFGVWSVQPLQMRGNVQMRKLDTGERFVEVRRGGTGFMSLSRRAVEKLSEGRRKYRGGMPNAPRVCLDVFDKRFDGGFGDPDLDGYMGEDYDLCDRWREMGETVWCNIDAQLVHVGSTEHAGKFTDTYGPAES